MMMKYSWESFERSLMILDDDWYEYASDNLKYLKIIILKNEIYW